MIQTVNELTLAIAGSGGDGVITIGDLLITSVAREGLHAMNIKSYGPQIRGGESSTRLRVAGSEVLSQGDEVDALVTFNWSDYAKFAAELPLKEGAVVLYDTRDKTDPRAVLGDKNVSLYPVAFEELARESAGTSLAKNMVCLGLVCALFNLPSEGIKDTIRRKFAKKGPKIIEANLKALAAGEAYAATIEREEALALDWQPADPHLVVTGNEAISYGALFAGCRFYAGYPITPSSEILEWMAAHLPQFGGVAVQPEDEMAAVGMVLGASFAGVKAMTSTSGPGFSLMSEIIGLASMVELPIVVADIQRTGPSTGIPTKSEQGDLNIALFGGHGDSPRVVMAPADVEDCFAVAVEAFYIAERYQIPVIILSDQFVSQRKETVRRSRLTNEKGFGQICERLTPTAEQLTSFRRFAPGTDGVSPTTYPGLAGGMYNVTGIEHNEVGEPTSDAALHETMSAKRYAKLEAIARDHTYHREYGAKEAKVGVLAWGSTKGAVKEALMRLEAAGHEVSGFVPQIIHPLPKAPLHQWLNGLETLIVIELSYSRQFLHYVRSQARMPPKVIPFSRSGGLPFTAGEIEARVLEVLAEVSQ